MGKKTKSETVRLEGLTRGERICINHALAQYRWEKGEMFLARKLVRRFEGDADEFGKRTTFKLSKKLHAKLKEVVGAVDKWPTALITSGGSLQIVTLRIEKDEGGALELLQRFGLLPEAEDLEDDERPSSAASDAATEGSPCAASAKQGEK